MKKTILVGLLNMLFVYGYAQRGIHFDQASNWQEIIEKAKKEHKYIFVDCYATWCGPCKVMDQEVYSLKEVGDVYNNEFISIKLQMDSAKGDNKEVKSRYGMVKQFASTYAVNGFPTFLFFNSEGRPVHKVTGSMNVKDFISLASEAKNSEKQYYTLVKNFQPGKFAKEELVSLMNVFAYVDKDLAGKMAADYLSRSADSALHKHMDMMLLLRNNPTVLQKAIGYIRNLGKKEIMQSENVAFIVRFKTEPEVQAKVLGYLKQLNRQEINEKQTLILVTNFFENPELHKWAVDYVSSLSYKEMEQNLAWLIYLKGDLIVKKIAMDYISKLNKNELEKETNVDFAIIFNKEQKIQEMAKSYEDNYLFKLDIKSALTKSNIKFVLGMLEGTKNNDFQFVMKFADTIDKVIGSNQAKSTLINAIIISEVKPNLDKLKENKEWDIEEQKCNNEYGLLGTIAVLQCRAGYFWLDQKDKDWKSIGLAYKLYYDKVGTLNIFNRNNFAYEIFRHVNDKSVLETALKVIEPIKNDQSNTMDTYANLLYKTGNKEEALAMEKKANEANPADKEVQDTYEKMKKGLPTWIN